MTALATVHLGPSAFTANGWVGTFYPRAVKPADYLAYYAEHFDTVEIDSTLYGCPKPSTVENWNVKTPAGFTFPVKTPRIITHDKVLVDCDTEMTEFISTMDLLGEKLGSVMLQFPFFSRAAFKTQIDFLDRLIPFLKRLPRNHRYAVEIRNRDWLDTQFVGLLRDFGVTLVLQGHPLMPRPQEIEDKLDPITSDRTYVRWLGDRKGIEQITTTWDKIVADRTVEMNHCYRTMKRGVEVYVYVNNHYAGYAPATIQQFRDIWKKKSLPALPEQQPRPKPPQAPQQSQLFDDWPIGAPNSLRTGKFRQPATLANACFLSSPSTTVLTIAVEILGVVGIHDYLIFPVLLGGECCSYRGHFSSEASSLGPRHYAATVASPGTFGLFSSAFAHAILDLVMIAAVLIFAFSIGVTFQFSIYMWRARMLKVVVSMAATPLGRQDFSSMDALQQLCPSLEDSIDHSLRAVRLYHAAVKMFGSADWVKNETPLCTQFANAILSQRIQNNQTIAAQVCSY